MILQGKQIFMFCPTHHCIGQNQTLGISNNYGNGIVYQTGIIIYLKQWWYYGENKSSFLLIYVPQPPKGNLF